MPARDHTNDCRKLDPKQQAEMRRRVVVMIQEGMPALEAARVFHVAPRSVFHWLARYRHGGWGALETAARPGRPRTLDGRKVQWIYHTVTTKNPLQLKFQFALWTREMVRALIKARYGLRLSVSSVGRLLRQLGLSVQRPLWRAWQQDPAAVAQWKTEEFPKIRRAAHRLGATVYFQDESGLRSDFHAGTTWAKRGTTPIVPATGARFALNMISAVSPRGDLRFMVTERRLNAGLFCEFLDRLMHHEAGHVFLIVDGHPAHKAKLVRRHLDKYAGRLRLYFLPPYSPELNPDEYVWGWVKTHRVGRQVYASKLEMRALVTSALRALQRQADTIIRFFRAPDLRYIAM
jgi:transposase